MVCDINTRVRALVLINTVLLLATVITVGVVYYDAQWRVHRVTRLVSSVQPGGGRAPQGMASALGAVLNSATKIFFFGSADGSVVRFLQNVLAYNFALLGSQVQSTALAVETGFNVNFPQCQNPSVPCVGPSTVSIASLVESIGNRLSGWRQVQAETTQAAFSDGLLRLDLLLEWVRAQVNPANRQAWISAGGLCRSVVSRVNQLDWFGSYVWGGEVMNWNVQQQVANVNGFIDEICQGLTNLPTV